MTNMPNPISAIGSVPGLDAIRPLGQAGKPGEFQALLEGTIDKLQSIHNDAADAVQKFLSGENEELHTAVLTAEKAEIAFDLGLQVRNKVVQAYQEIMRMQM
jgi:flagellar hook-basal body complex protein FliE